MCEVVLSKSDGNLLELLLGNSKNQNGSQVEPIFYPPKLPNDLNQSIVDRVWSNVGDSSVENLKQVIIDDSLIRGAPIVFRIDTQVDILILQKIGFKYVDFLYKNHFATPESVQHIFHDPDLLDKTLDYIYYRFLFDTKTSILMGSSPYITEHWYWPLLHESFKALSEEEEKMINITLAIKKLKFHFFQTAPQYYRESKEWTTFVNSIEVNLFNIKKLKTDHDDTMKENEDVSGLEELNRQIMRIIELLLMTRDASLTTSIAQGLGKNQLDEQIVDLFDLLELYVLTPETIREIAGQHSKFYQFLDRFELIRFTSRIIDLTKKINSYHQFISKLPVPPSLPLPNIPVNLVRPPLTVKVNHHRATLDVYIHQLESIIPLLKNKFHSVLEQNDETSSWLRSQLNISQVEAMALEWLLEFKDKSKEVVD